MVSTGDKSAILTGKQRHFAQCVAAGMTQSDAYREAYNVGEKTKHATIHVKASALMATDKIRARVDALISMRDKAFIRSSTDMKTKVLKQLEDFMASADPSDNVRLRATELLGKSVGLFKEVIEDSRTVVRTSDELEAEVLAKLAILLEDDAGATTH
jgi:hypothetical protein